MAKGKEYLTLVGKPDCEKGSSLSQAQEALNRKLPRREPYQTACEICGNNTSSVSKRCNNCWQVEHRLEEYLKHKAGRDKVAEILLRMDADRL